MYGKEVLFEKFGHIRDRLLLLPRRKEAMSHVNLLMDSIIKIDPHIGHVSCTALSRISEKLPLVLRLALSQNANRSLTLVMASTSVIITARWSELDA